MLFGIGAAVSAAHGEPRLITEASDPAGTGAASVAELTDVGGTLFFTAREESSGWELWKSDGSVTGTARIKDIVPGPGSGSPRDLVAAGGRLFFNAYDLEAGFHLWSSDGTTAGTRRLKVIGSGAENDRPRSMIAAGGKLFFVMPAGSADDSETLWCSDGTEGGTRKVEIPPLNGRSGGFNNLVEFQGELYFTVGLGTLHRSDGTPEGTVRVRDLPVDTGGSVRSPVVVGDHLYLIFESSLPADGGWLHASRVWQTDGTEVGTRQADFWEDRRAGESASAIMVAGRSLLVSTWDAEGNTRILRTDGSRAGTTLLDPASQGVFDGAWNEFSSKLGAGALYSRFSGRHGNEVWFSGEVTGPRMLRDLEPGKSGSEPKSFTAAGEDVYFVARRSIDGDSVWKMRGSDGRIVQVAKGKGGKTRYQPHDLTPSGGRVFWIAYDGSTGGQLWCTTEGRRAARRLTEAGDTRWWQHPLARAGRTAGRDGVYYFPAWDAKGQEMLWRTDGTAEGTWRLNRPNPKLAGSFPENVTAAGDRVFYHASDGDQGLDLWMTDGTSRGTTIPYRLPPKERAQLAVPGVLGEIGGSVILSKWRYWLPAGFLRYDGNGGPVSLLAQGATPPGRPGDFIPFSDSSSPAAWEPWTSDGTLEGTRLLKDIGPGSSSSAPRWLGSAGGRSYLAASDHRHGHELWVTDGTEAGTKLVKDITPGIQGTPLSLGAPLGNCLVFFAEIPAEPPSGYRGHTLWITDGSEAGTRPIAQVGQGLWDRFLNNPTTPFASVGTRCLLFSGSVDLRNSELWTTDGTPEGTGKLREIHPGEKGSDPQWLTGTGGSVYFSADDGHSGRELWRSDGSTEGTVLVKDLTGDGNDSAPWGLSFTGGKLFFMARHGSRGTEPHVIDTP